MVRVVGGKCNYLPGSAVCLLTRHQQIAEVKQTLGGHSHINCLCILGVPASLVSTSQHAGTTCCTGSVFALRLLLLLSPDFKASIAGNMLIWRSNSWADEVQRDCAAQVGGGFQEVIECR